MFKKLRGKLKGGDQPSSSTSQNQYHAPPGATYQPSPQLTEKYKAPTGPPSGYNPQQTYAPPPGPPPTHRPTNAAYAAPPGQPPTHTSNAFPHQPPPTWDPPPYHDWTVIPDTSLLPPPPSLGYETSPTANSTQEQGDRAYAWCNAHPLWAPQRMHPATLTAIRNAQLALLKPPSCTGEVRPQPAAGHWRCRTHAACGDSAILANMPMYAALHDSPAVTGGQGKVIYFEVKVVGVGRGGNSSFEEADSGIAIGFVAPPYPTFRLPGWQRGGLGVHGDDGRRYVNDTWGGVDFTTAFQPGDTVGIGMVFGVPGAPPGYEEGKSGGGMQKVLDVEVFFTRNGKKEGGWDGNEELDERSEGGTVGLRGECDLFPAIGVFGGVDFDVFFHPSQWLYKPF